MSSPVITHPSGPALGAPMLPRIRTPLPYGSSPDGSMSVMPKPFSVTCETVTYTPTLPTPRPSISTRGTPASSTAHRPDASTSPSTTSGAPGRPSLPGSTSANPGSPARGV